MQGADMNGLLSAPLTVPAAVAGALAALLLVLLLLALRRAGPGMLRIMIGFVALAAFAAAVTVIADRMATNERAAEWRALLARNVELTARASAPGSMLSCLDGGAGEAVENLCEKTVFSDAQSAAAAVAYMGARLTLLRQAAAIAPSLPDGLSGLRRAVELDRYGLAAHVLAERDGCTADKCPLFAALHDSAALKANMRVHAFDNYVARYAADWSKTAPVAEKPAQAAPVAAAPQPAPAREAKAPLDGRYDFPSAASIPPVSIMNPEPALPKEPAENAAPPEAAPADNPAPTAKLPQRRSQKQASEPPAR
jgi:hypothetical protein